MEGGTLGLSSSSSWRRRRTEEDERGRIAFVAFEARAGILVCDGRQQLDDASGNPRCVSLFSFLAMVILTIVIPDPVWRSRTI